MSTPVDDPYWTPNVEVHNNEDGSTVVTGYPSSGTSGLYDGPVSTAPPEGVEMPAWGDGSGVPIPESPAEPA